MKKKKLKAKIKTLKAQVLDARTSAVASSIAKMIVGGMLGGKAIDLGAHTIAVSREPEKDEPEIIGALRRAAMAAKTKP
jgi:hypothetical protein